MERARPEWSTLIRAARRTIREAEEVIGHAENSRCPARESGGIQCTLDRGHKGDHRTLQEDLP